MPTLHLTDEEYDRVAFLVRHHGDAKLERAVACAAPPYVAQSAAQGVRCGARADSWSCELPIGHSGRHSSREGLKVWG